MTRSVQTIPNSASLREATALLLDPATKHPTFPVVDENGRRVLRLIDPPAIIRWRRQRRSPAATVGLLSEDTSPTTVYPGERIEVVVERMNSANIAHVPVIARSESRLVGYLGWKDIIASQALAHGGDSSIPVRDTLATRAEHSSAL